MLWSSGFPKLVEVEVKLHVQVFANISKIKIENKNIDTANSKYL